MIEVLLVLALASGASASEYDEAMKLKEQGRLAEAEQSLLVILKQTPTDTKALEQLALVQSWQNKFDLSIASWRQLVSLQPEDNQARIGLARVLYWKEERAEAVQVLKQVTQKNDQDVTAWTLLGDVYMAEGDMSQARESYVRAQKLTPNADPELKKKIANAVPPNSWRLDARIISDTYSNERDNELGQYLQLGYTTQNKTSFYGKLEQFNQFEEKDVSWGVGMYWSPTESLLINPEWNSAGSNADFRPETQWGINVDWIATKPVQLLLAYRSSEYKNANSQGDVTTLTPGVRFVVGSNNFELRHAKTENLDDTDTSVNSVKWSWEGERYRPYLMYTTGKESTPPIALAEIDVLSGGLVWSVNRNLGLRFDVAREDRKDAYKHTVMGVGVSTYF